MRYSDLVRQPVGTTHIYEATQDDRRSLVQTISGTASRLGGKVTFTSINGFASNSGEPVYLLKVEVVQSGQEVQIADHTKENYDKMQFIYKGELLSLNEIARLVGLKYISAYSKIVKRHEREPGSDVTDLFDDAKIKAKKIAKQRKAKLSKGE